MANQLVPADLELTIAWEDLEKSELGPAMQDLTRLQQRFVWAMVMTGGRDHTAAARMAGFSSASANGLRVTAHRLTHDPRVLAAIQEVGRQRLQNHLLLGAEVLIGIADGQYGAKASDRLKAIEMIFGRAGLPQVTEQHVLTVTETRSDAELLAEVDKKLAAVGMRISDIIKKPVTVDTEYRVVDTGAEGLEDLLG
jgi:phage terminase small subunit